MERVEIMNSRVKNTMGVISFLPILAYIGWLIQFIYLHNIYPDVQTSTILYENYSSTLLFFTLCFILTSSVLVYFVVHLARTKLMNPGSKLVWIIFMTFMAPIAFIAFWYTEIRNEPERLPIYPDIA
jgi:hypothetical protein